VAILPFRPIKLRTPSGASRQFPPEIRSVSAAMAFIDAHVAPAKQNEMHWRLARDALLNAVATGGSYAHARQAMHHALATEGWDLIPGQRSHGRSQVGAALISKPARQIHTPKACFAARIRTYVQRRLRVVSSLSLVRPRRVMAGPFFCSAAIAP